MKLTDLQDVADEAELAIRMCSMQARRGTCRTDDEEGKLYWIIGRCTVLRDELKEHIRSLERILRVCKAVKQGRYLDAWQRCTRWGQPCAHACTSDEWCDGFDARDPYTVIAAELSEIKPLSEPLRGWILLQWEMQRSRRERMFGPKGLFGGRKIVMYQDDGSGVLTPMSEDDSAAALAAHEARQDAKNESRALRLEQYDLNLQRLADLCRVQGDLQEIAAIIEGGMPPQVRPAIAPS
jgi:hypothetical protein